MNYLVSMLRCGHFLIPPVEGKNGQWSYPARCPGAEHQDKYKAEFDVRNFEREAKPPHIVRAWRFRFAYKKTGSGATLLTVLEQSTRTRIKRAANSTCVNILVDRLQGMRLSKKFNRIHKTIISKVNLECFFKAPLHMECICDKGRGRGWVKRFL